MKLLAERFRLNDYQRYYPREEISEVYSQSKIVFNTSINDDLNMRVFEALASGSMLLTDRINNGQSELFKHGSHLVEYSSDEELLQAAEYYLSHEAEREQIAGAGHDLALDRHTYAHRCQLILDTIFGSGPPRLEARARRTAETEVRSAYATVYKSFLLFDPLLAELRFAWKHRRGWVKTAFFLIWITAKSMYRVFRYSLLNHPNMEFSRADTTRRILQNSSVLIAGQIAGALLSFATSIFLVRSLGSAGYGQYAFIYAFLGLFAWITSFGTDNIIARESVENPENADAVWSNGLLVQILFSVLAFGIMTATVLRTGKTNEAFYLFAVGGIEVLLIAPWRLASRVFQVKLQQWRGVLATLIRQVIWFGVVFSFSHFPVSLPAFVWARTGVAVIEVLLLCVLALPFVHIRFQIDTSRTRALLLESWPLAVLLSAWPYITRSTAS